MGNTDQNTSRPIRIFMATPSYDAKVHTGYAVSLVKTYSYFQKIPNIDIFHQFRLHDCSIPRARNYFAAFFLSDPSLTHLLFIDADINWKPEDIEKLLQSNKPIIAATFPKKQYFWDKLRSEHVQKIIMDKKMSAEEFQRRIKANLVDYAINFGDSREVKNNIIEVKHVATAFMMIERQVLEKMCAQFPERKINNHNDIPPHVHQHLYSLFEQENEQGEYLSSDYSFCRLWSKTGGKVFADLSITLSHHGTEDFVGNIMDLGYPKPPSSLS
ncbi:MAG: hypothetical protein AB7I18_06745 [Candidatus Berkiella sp.]